METFHLYFLCASVLSLGSFRRVFAAPASGPNSAKVPGNSKDELTHTRLAEQLAQSSTKTNGNMVSGFLQVQEKTYPCNRINQE